MDAVTYPNAEVVRFLREYLIPFRIDISHPSMHEKYHTFWTPTTVISGIKGKNVQGEHEAQRRIGFFEPDEFIATLHLGIAKVRLDQNELDTAMVHLNRLFKEHPKSDLVPEAIYFRGVIQYKQSNDPGMLKQAYEQLSKDFPGSSWAKRAYPYRLLK